MTKLMRIVIVGCAALALAAGCGKDDKKDEGGGGKSGSPSATDKGGDKGPDLAALEQVKADGWTLKATRSGQTITYNGQTEIDGKKVGALAQAGKCEMAMLCPKLEQAEFEKMKDNFKAMMSNAVANDPNTTFEIAPAEIAGRKVMTVHSYGWTEKDGSKLTSHAMNVYWNDGKNMITLMLSDFSQPSAASFDEFKAAITRTQLDKAAETLMKGFEGKL